MKKENTGSSLYRLRERERRRRRRGWGPGGRDPLRPSPWLASRVCPSPASG